MSEAYKRLAQAPDVMAEEFRCILEASVPELPNAVKFRLKRDVRAAIHDAVMAAIKAWEPGVGSQDEPRKVGT